MLFTSIFYFFHNVITLSQTKILNSSMLNKFTDDNFKFDENGVKFSERVENTVEKEEIARYEQFLFSHSVFKRFVLQTRKNQGLFGKGIKGFFLRGIKSRHYVLKGFFT